MQHPWQVNIVAVLGAAGYFVHTIMADGAGANNLVTIGAIR